MIRNDMARTSLACCAVVIGGFAVSAVTASTAAAATTVGSPSLSSSGTDFLTCITAPCVLVQDQIDGADVATPKGVITSWSVRNAAGTIALRVLRKRSGEYVAGELHATNISESADETGSGSDSAPEIFDARQPVEAGDYIGITLVSGSEIGYLSGSGDERLFEVDGDPTLTNVDSTTPYNLETLVSASVEPDADGDGFGDESQDGCPSRADTQAACPVASPPPPFIPPPPPFVPPVSTAATTKVRLGSRSATFKLGKASVKLKNPNAVGVKGKLSLKLRKKVVGSRSYSLAAGAAGTIKVKLAQAARKRIAKQGKVKLSLRITAKGATGKTFNTAATLTVKKAPRKQAQPQPQPQPQPVPDSGSSLDGKYEKDPDSGPNIRFTVTGGGRRIVNLTGSIAGACFIREPFSGNIRTEFRALFAAMESMEVAADGSFSGSQELEGTTTEITDGQLAGGSATATISVRSGGCQSGKQNFKSLRTGP